MTLDAAANQVIYMGTCTPFTGGQVIHNDNTWSLVASVEVAVELENAALLDKSLVPYNCHVPGIGLPTPKWQSVTTPSGIAKIVCQGVME